MPDQAPECSSSSAITGLYAVCQTTHWWPHSRMQCSLSATWYRYASSGSPSFPAPRTQVPAQVLPLISGPSLAGSGVQAATTSRGETSAPRTRTGSVRSRPIVCSTWRMLMNSSPNPYLKVTRSQSTQRGTSSTSSCSTLTHSTGPIPSGKSNVSGSENGGVVNQPRSRSQITGGLRHSSMVVQIEKLGANAYPSTSRLAPSRTPTSSIRENSSSAAWRANTSASPGSTPIPTSASWSRDSQLWASWNWTSPSLTPTSSWGRCGCGLDSVIAMSR